MKVQTPLMLSDQPTNRDLLGYEKAVLELTDIILSDNTEPPFTIGIFGKWGTGKTSFMKMIQTKIKSRSVKNGEIFTVWFDPWRYDEKELIWEALIQTILLELYDNAKSRGHKLEVAKLTAKFLAVIGGEAIKFATLDGFDVFETLERVEKFIKPKFDEIRFWNKFDSNFSEIVTNLVDEKGRLIVFIDDLDRCLPENALQVLEAIKLFLTQKNCIFILGLDKQIIEDAITARYEKKIPIRGIEYLEKIIQLPFLLPTVRDEDIQQFIDRLVGQARVDQAKGIIKAGANNNPRRIKRFINIFILLRSIAKADTIREDQLAKIVMIQLRFPEFYHVLNANPEVLDQLTDLAKMDEVNRSSYLEKHRDLEEFADKTDLIKFLKDTKDIRFHDDLFQYLRLTQSVDI